MDAGAKAESLAWPVRAGARRRRRASSIAGWCAPPSPRCAACGSWQVVRQLALPRRVRTDTGSPPPPACSPPGRSAPSRPAQWSPARPPTAAAAPPGQLRRSSGDSSTKAGHCAPGSPLAPESCRLRALNSPHPLLSPAAPAQPGRSAPSWAEPVPPRRFSDSARVGPCGSASESSRNPSVPLCPRSCRASATHAMKSWTTPSACLLVRRSLVDNSRNQF